MVTPSSESGSNALRCRISTPLSVATPSNVRPQRANTTRDRRDKSMPASVLVGQRATTKAYPDRNKMRTLDRRSHGDQKAVRRILAPNIGINFVAARQAPATRYLRPMAQHPIDQSPLFLHRLGPCCRVIVRTSASMSGEG